MNHNFFKNLLNNRETLALSCIKDHMEKEKKKKESKKGNGRKKLPSKEREKHPGRVLICVCYL